MLVMELNHLTSATMVNIFKEGLFPVFPLRKFYPEQIFVLVRKQLPKHADT